MRGIDSSCLTLRISSAIMSVLLDYSRVTQSSTLFAVQEQLPLNARN